MLQRLRLRLRLIHGFRYYTVNRNRIPHSRFFIERLNATLVNSTIARSPGHSHPQAVEFGVYICQEIIENVECDEPLAAYASMH